MPGDCALTQDLDRRLAAALDRAREIKNAYGAELMGKANVVGLGVGMRTRDGAQTHEVALVVMVTRKLPPSLLDPDDLLPKVIEGVPVDVQAVGELKPQREGGGEM